MPVRIYDISKQLGLEIKEVLVKARELGIHAAKVPSSSLDKITAEFLVEQLGGKRIEAVPVSSVSLVHQVITAPSPVVTKGDDNTLVDQGQEIVIAKQTVVHVFRFGTAFEFIGSFPFNSQNPTGTVVHGFKEEIALLSNRESKSLEFKASARWNFQEKRENPNLTRAIVKTVAAFLNTEGGNLFIGVGNNGKIVGLAHDLKTLGQKQNEEGFEHFLNQTISSGLGVFAASLITLRFHQVINMTVAQLCVRKSPKAIYVTAGEDKVLFTRNGNLTEKVPTDQIVDYSLARWPEKQSGDARYS